MRIGDYFETKVRHCELPKLHVGFDLNRCCTDLGRRRRLEPVLESDLRRSRRLRKKESQTTRLLGKRIAGEVQDACLFAG